LCKRSAPALFGLGDGFGRGDAHGGGQRVACHIKVLTDFQRVRILSEQALFGEFLLLHRSLLLFAEKLDLVLEVFSKASDKGEPFLAVDHAVINAFL